MGGCRKKPLEKTRSTLAEVHLRAVVHDALASDRLRATHEMAIFGTHPYRRSSGLARGFPDSHLSKQELETTPGHLRVARPDLKSTVLGLARYSRLASCSSSSLMERGRAARPAARRPPAGRSPLRRRAARRPAPPARPARAACPPV